MKVYSFIGTPCYDILIYLSMLLKNMGKKVLVVDNSKDQEVMNCIQKPLDLEGLIHYNQVDYIGEEISNNEITYEYDIILRLLAYSEIPDLDEELQKLIVVTDTKRKSLEGAMQVLINNNFSKQLIIRDVCDGRFGKHYFSKVCMNEQAEYAISKRNIYEVDFDELDYYYRIMLEHKVFRRFYSLSRSYKDLLFDLASEISQMPIKSVKKAYKAGKRVAI